MEKYVHNNVNVKAVLWPTVSLPVCHAPIWRQWPDFFFFLFWVSASCCACNIYDNTWWWLVFKPKHVVIHVFNKARWNIVANRGLLYSFITRFLLLSDSCGFVDVGCPLWPEGRSVVYNCCRSSPAQSFSGAGHAWLTATLYCGRLPLPNLEGQVLVLTATETEWTSYTPRQRVPFSPLPTTRRCTLVSWRYSNPPPREV
jgi:hypothetical protein